MPVPWIWDLSSGAFRLLSADDPNVGATAMAMLNSLNGLGPKATNLYALTRVGGQDILIQAANPEPASLGLMLAGLAALVGVHKRRRRRAAR